MRQLTISGLGGSLAASAMHGFLTDKSDENRKFTIMTI